MFVLEKSRLKWDFFKVLAARTFEMMKVGEMLLLEVLTEKKVLRVLATQRQIFEFVKLLEKQCDMFDC